MISLGRHISLWNNDERLIALSQARPVFRSQNFDVRIMPKQGPIARLIVITPKKVGSAPMRNLLKRRSKSIFYQDKMHTSANDWIIFFLPSHSILGYEKLRSQLLELFNKYG